ncbi:phage antirepressor KilAC domain-containing protein [Yersinia bercovieri]|uniref:phage antirepressor KilAC domain-containing protein n=1 Tax=Yersinia bercovieri TaxID=634 RepID=UPI0005E4E56F|nr:phage antirepressor KilAC domain-containing protein [Yersinia bercovieri]CNI61010.1 phage regulatory protein [Yersinia bercovieri]
MKSMIAVGQEATMTSLDFLKNIINPARLEYGEPEVENRHFLSRIEDEIDDLGVAENFYVTTEQGASRAVRGYKLNMEQMTLIGMRESKAVRRSVLAKLKVMHGPAIPQTLPEALRLAADLAEHNAKLTDELAIAAPKIDFVDNYVNASGSFGFREACKLLKAKEPEFRAFLIVSNVMYVLGGKMTPRAPHIDAGRFTVKTGENLNNGHAFTQAKFTPKGIQWIAGLWASWQLNNQAA